MESEEELMKSSYYRFESDICKKAPDVLAWPWIVYC